MVGGRQRKIEVFGTSIMSTNKIRSNHEKVTRILAQAKLTFDFLDIGSSEELKLRFKKTVASSHVKSAELPFILSGGEAVGTVEQLEEAVECGELRQFLLLEKPVVESQEDELLGDLSPEQIQELGGELATSSLPAQRVAAEVRDLTGKAHVEVPIEPAPTPTQQQISDINASKIGESAAVLSQMLVGKDNLALIKERELQRS